MNKLILVMIGVVFMCLSTGCSGMFQAIEKDTVMVKKIMNENKMSEVQYEGVLAQDAVKAISLNAVNKSYNEKLTIDEVQFEIMNVDQKKLKDLLDRVEAEFERKPRERKEQMLQVDFTTELNKVPSGLFYITLSRTTDPKVAFDVVVNARDGDVMRINQVDQNPRVSGVAPAVLIDDEVIGIANRFIQEKEGYDLSSLDLQKKHIRLGLESQLYYTRKETRTFAYSVSVNVGTKQVVGFSKDIMAIFHYYSGS